MVVSLLSACVPSDSGVGYVNNITSIAYLKSLYSGVPTYLTSDIIIRGVVTANNKFGELPSTLIIEDESGGIELNSECDFSAFGFNVGQCVTILCGGLWMGSNGGALSLGDAPSGDYPTTALSSELTEQHISIYSGEYTPLTAKYITVSDLQYEHISTTQYMKGVTFESPYTTFCSRDEEGESQSTTHTLLDGLGDEITLWVYKGVDYADQSLPTQPVTVQVLIEYYNSEYSVRIVNGGVFYSD